MKSSIYMDGEKFIESEFKTEEEFEKIVKENSKIFFGQKTIYFEIKNKIDTKSLGSVVPDGFLFDFKDPENPEFYIVEVELSKHDFYKHIFPQITKFFAFFKNSKKQSDLIDKLFSFIKSNHKIESEFKSFLGQKEVYKELKEMIENSQNILIIIDENKPEFQEIMETYTDTWDKMVKVIVLKQYISNKKTIFTMTPDFEDIGFIESLSDVEKETYTESFHTEGVDQKIISIYEKLKGALLEIDPQIRINPQKYYISLRHKKNFAYLFIKKKKMKITLMLPYKIGSNIIKKHKIIEESGSVQKFYGGPCFSIFIENEDNFDEIIKAIEEAYKQQNN
jgi:predicted transport protein